MGEKLAVAVIHGIGKTERGYARGMIEQLHAGVADACGAAAVDDVVVKEILWADVVQNLENELERRVGLQDATAYGPLRSFLISFAADAVAYQTRPSNPWLYDRVHAEIALGLHELAREAGPRAPLCFVAHSLGSIIASNFLYDLQVEAGHAPAPRVDSSKSLVPAEAKAVMGDTPLERGETLSHFFTLGSPLAIWSLANTDFGVPIQVPAPQFAAHHPKLAASAGWYNMYDRQDVLAYPLKGLNDAHAKAVREDLEVDVGVVPVNWTPLAHTKYWTDANVVRPIVSSLAEAWKALNPQLAPRV